MLFRVSNGNINRRVKYISYVYDHTIPLPKQTKTRIVLHLHLHLHLNSKIHTTTKHLEIHMHNEISPVQHTTGFCLLELPE